MKKEEVLALRKKLGMTQAVFASHIGCTVATLSRWETGGASPSRLYVKEIKALEATHGNKAS